MGPATKHNRIRGGYRGGVQGVRTSANHESINSRYLLFSCITALTTSGYGDEAVVSNDIDVFLNKTKKKWCLLIQVR